MNLRLFTGSDLEECTNVFVHVFNQAPWNDEWTTVKAFQYLNDFVNTPGFLGIVAEDGEEIIGFVFGVRKRWWSGDEFFVHELCVSTEKQHMGIGTSLLKYLEAQLELIGVKNIVCLTDRGTPAELFYEKNGFAVIDRIIFLHKDTNTK